MQLLANYILSVTILDGKMLAVCLLGSLLSAKVVCCYLQ